MLYEKRAKYPLVLACALALLANTNVHSAILVCLITFVWVWDLMAAQRATPAHLRESRIWLPFLIVLVGVLSSAIFAVPRENTILTSVRHSFDVAELTGALFQAARYPELTFVQIVPTALPRWMVTALLYLAVLGLIRRPSLFLAALGGLIAFGVLTRMVYSTGYRHQGLFLVFLLFLYWLYLRSPRAQAVTRATHAPFRVGFYGAMLVLLLVSVFEAKDLVLADIGRERSSSRAFGQFLEDSEAYRNAIIVPEPDYLLESLPYYASNLIYLPREHRFGTTVSWTTESNPALSLGTVLSIARDLDLQYDRPVLIVLGHRQIDQDTHGQIDFSFNKTFSWTAEDLDDLNGATTIVADFKAAYTDENYRVYALD